VSEGSPAGAPGPPTNAAAYLSITTARPGPGMVRVDVIGEIDLATAPRLRVALLAAIAATAAGTEIRVNLAEVTFIDAIGVGVLVRARGAASRAGVGLSLEHPRGLVLRILELLDLVDTLLATPDQPASPSC
jgi:anti-sigma B factor antagonist